MSSCAINASAAVELWDLEPHPEGGFFRRTYVSSLTTTPAGWPGPRPLATSILYLLPAHQQSRLHRVRGDELWLWQGGDPMRVDVEGTPYMVGPDRRAGHELQVLVPGGAWQSATALGDDWSLVACVVTPGFDYADFELR